jgi:hypothetical protein
VDGLKLLEQQMWHSDGLPSPKVTVTTRYAKHDAILDKLSNVPIIEIDWNYRIRANRLGLYGSGKFDYWGSQWSQWRWEGGWGECF